MVSSDWKVFGIDMHCLLNCERGEKVASRVGFGSLECMSAGEGADQEEEKWSREFRGSAAWCRYGETGGGLRHQQVGDMGRGIWHLAILPSSYFCFGFKQSEAKPSAAAACVKARRPGGVGGFWPPASPSPGHDSREAASAPPSNFVLTPPAYMLSRCTSHICHVHSQQNNVFRPFSGLHQAVYCLLTWEVFLLTHEDAVQSQDKPGGSHSTCTRALLGNSEYYKVQCRGNFRLSGLVSVAFFFPVNFHTHHCH